MARKAMQRLFFALWPDVHVRDELVRVGTMLPESTGRPAHPRDLHMTLHFLGHVNVEGVQCLVDAAGSIRSPTFQLTLNKVGHWGRPGLTWCAPSQVPMELTGLVNRLGGVLESCGYQPEQREYRPHVTLVRKVGELALFKLEEAIIWDISEFSLVVSRSDTGVPRYRELRKWSLGL
ncbi:MAG: RNA 2',3'-cyclic phosphodiesterase [Gammaproteobacteria bacterium]|nr:RNA 2',3'-cyclic phosphodiesterase [Gammaproteobacteria bacterium]